MIPSFAPLIDTFFKRFPLAVVVLYVIPFLTVSLQADHSKLNESERVETIELIHPLGITHKIKETTANTEGTKSDSPFNAIHHSTELAKGFVRTEFLKLYILYQTASHYKRQVLPLCVH